MSDAHIVSFLADVLALEGESPEAIREGPRLPRPLPPARIVEEMQRRKGTATEVHLKFVLSLIDGPRFQKRL